MHRKIGNHWLTAVALTVLVTAPVRAEEATFTAEVDRQEITLDDSVGLKLMVQSAGGVSADQPQFKAPDFEVINEYSSNYVESFYDGTTGKFGVKNNRSLTKILKPMKTGDLKISGIQIRVNGKVQTAPDITVQVGASGAGTPPPRGYGGGGVGLRGAGKKTAAPQVFVRAEIDRDRVYKGEQLVVSYYLYQRARTFNISVDKFPDLNGFLREDIEMPVLGTHLNMERVVLDGVAYQRGLLVRYAAYPLQEGKLKIDSLGLKYSYYSNPGVTDDGEDPFLNFFQQLTPRSTSTRSEAVAVEVLPLPTEGKPDSFSGAVGDFSISAAVDKTEVRANEAVTLKVKVEGRGNVAAVGEPKAKWPDNVELYDSKGIAKTSKAGVGEKVFEFLLIPRAPGKITLPALDFSFFDPIRKTYASRSTDPVEINVLEAAPGTAVITPKSPSASKASGQDEPVQSSADNKVRSLKMPDGVPGAVGAMPVWRILYWIFGVVFGGFALFVAGDMIRRALSHGKVLLKKQAEAEARSWTRLKQDAKKAVEGAPWQEVLGAYDRLAALLLEAIDRRFGLGAKSLSRAEIKRRLVDEEGVPEAVWKKVEKLLETSELARFVGAFSGISEETARLELGRWVDEGQVLTRQIEEFSPAASVADS